MVKRSFATLASLAGILMFVAKRRKRSVPNLPDIQLESIEQSTNAITFRWKEGIGFYRLYREGQLIYSGSDISFSDKGLDPATSYLYTVEMMETTSGPVKIQTATKPEKSDGSNILKDIIVTTVVSRSLISLDWEPISGVSEYIIKRNGKKLACVTNCFYTDKTVRQDAEYTYSIEAERILPYSEENLNEPKFLAAGIIGFFKRGRKREKDATMERFRMTKKIRAIEQVLQSNGKGCETEWRFLYQTFLNNKWIKNPNFFSPYRYFQGDNRGFDPHSSNYRTKAEVHVRFGGGTRTPHIQFGKDVGETRGYGWTKRMKDRATASSDGMKVEEIEKSSEKAIFRLTHSVKNPLVVSPAVDYEVCANFWRDGLYDISGKHDQSPHHEVYVQSGGQSKAEWEPLHQAQDQGLEWMSGTMASQYWRVSNLQ